MRAVTIISLGASAVLGLGALFVARAVLPDAGPAAAEGASGPRGGVPVVVAARPIAWGARLEPAMLTVAKVPAEAAPEGAFTTVEQALAADRGGAPVTLAPIAQREAVLPTRLSGPGARPSLAAQITDGHRAYTIKVTDVTGVGGHALPGDRVDVVLTRDLTPEGSQRSYVSDVVLQNVRVLGIDLNADLAASKPASPNTATLEVPVQDAQKLSMAANLGFLSLALRRTGEAELAAAPPLRAGQFLTGGAAVRAAAPRQVSGARREAAVSVSPILIVEGAPRSARRRPAPAAGV